MRADLIQLPELGIYEALIAPLAYEPLLITLETLTPLVTVEPLNLDGLLAKGLMLMARRGRPLPATQRPFWMPLPVHCHAWVGGLPLWGTTIFLPTVPWTEDPTNFHKRTGDNPYSFPAIQQTLQDKRPRRRPSTAAGQYMDYRNPITLQIAEHWTATCLGHAGEIRRLLDHVTQVGKHAAGGRGRVARWTVTPLGCPFVLETDTGEPLRPIPTTEPYGQLSGWTPPYWKRDLWTFCRVPSMIGHASAS